MTHSEINRMAAIIYARQAEQDLLNQLWLFCREEGILNHTLMDLWYKVKHETEVDPFGADRHTLPFIEYFLNHLMQVK